VGNVRRRDGIRRHVLLKMPESFFILLMLVGAAGVLWMVWGMLKFIANVMTLG
jgi:hypothetical protein